MTLRGDYNSEVLRMSTNIQLLIPENSDAPFRIVYLLHGLHGNQGTWLDNTMLPYYSRKYNAVFVMPEAGRSFYLDHKYGRKYYTFISEELPQICRKVFNISARREDTAVMGCSMGGYGALRLALCNPEQYAFCGAISAACLYFRPMLDGLRGNVESYQKTGAEAVEVIKDLQALYGDSLEYRPEYDISELVKNYAPDKPRTRIYGACGIEDKLREENLKFKDEIIKAGLDYTYEEWSGGHEWYFFNEALKKALDFWYEPALA